MLISGVLEMLRSGVLRILRSEISTSVLLVILLQVYTVIFTSEVLEQLAIYIYA